MAKTAQQMVFELMKTMSRYKIAKHVGVSWRTVNLWSAGKGSLQDKNLSKLQEVHEEVFKETV